MVQLSNLCNKDHKKIPREIFKISFSKNRMGTILLATILSTSFAHASVESSLQGLKTVLLGSILPILAVIGLGFAGFSFFTGNPNAKQHLMYSLIGCAIIFGAQAIVDLMSRVVR